MLNFLRKKKLNNTPVEFTSLVQEGANFIVIFSEDTFLNYEILQYCANWDNRFRQFKFFLPAYSFEFFQHIRSFTKAAFYEIGSQQDLPDRSIILNLSTDPAIRKQLYGDSASLIIDGANTGNLHFLPKIGEAQKLFLEFCRFFSLELNKKKLEFEFSEKEIKSTNYHFFQNKFLNFLVDNHKLDQNTLKKIIINIKQNFPSNIYLNGQILRKHEFINLKNLSPMNLLDKYLLACNCDLLISDHLQTVKIFHDLDLKQLCIVHNEAPGSIVSVSTSNLHVIKDAIASILEK